MPIPESSRSSASRRRTSSTSPTSTTTNTRDYSPRNSAPSRAGRAFFSNSGTEAIEGAIKLARAAGHATGGAEKSIGSRWRTRSTAAPGALASPARQNTVRTSIRCWKACGSSRATTPKPCASDGRQGLRHRAGAHSGRRRHSGIVTEFLRACRELADQHQAALIFDEIQCGLGRTGQLFAFQHSASFPNGLHRQADGCRAAARSVSREEHFAQHITPGKHGTTFGGGPLACRVPWNISRSWKKKTCWSTCAKLARYFSQKLMNWWTSSTFRRSPRCGRDSALQFSVPGKPIVEGALAKGLLINVTQDTVLRFFPPFLLQEKHVDSGMRILRKLLAARRSSTKGRQRRRKARQSHRYTKTPSSRENESGKHECTSGLYPR